MSVSYFNLQNLASKETTRDNSEWKENCGPVSRSAWLVGGTTWGDDCIAHTSQGPRSLHLPGERAQPQSPSQSAVDEGRRTKAVEFGTVTASSFP